jgi:hypothetical protein
VQKFPAELEDLLSPRGRRVLAGKDAGPAQALSDRRAVILSGLLDAKRAKQVPALLQRAFEAVLTPFATTAPPALTATHQSGQERLPAIARGARAELGTPAAAERAHQIGLTALLTSASCRAFCERLAGGALPDGAADAVQLYRAFDYDGPRTGHRRGEVRVRYRAFELELGFATAGVTRQLAVHESDGHLESVGAVALQGGVIARLLPLWHYATPLETRSARECRWVIRRTFPPMAMEQT